MEYHHDRNPRVVPDDGARERTAGRLLVARLRVEIAAREAAQPSDPRIEEARRELRVLTGVDRNTETIVSEQCPLPQHRIHRSGHPGPQPISLRRAKERCRRFEPSHHSSDRFTDTATDGVGRLRAELRSISTCPRVDRRAPFSSLLHPRSRGALPPGPRALDGVAGRLRRRSGGRHARGHSRRRRTHAAQRLDAAGRRIAAPARPCPRRWPRYRRRGARRRSRERYPSRSPQRRRSTISCSTVATMPASQDGEPSYFVAGRISAAEVEKLFARRCCGWTSRHSASGRPNPHPFRCLRRSPHAGTPRHAGSGLHNVRGRVHQSYWAAGAVTPSTSAPRPSV